MRSLPDDFFVEELPLYQPVGDGEHLYVHIEKKGLTTLDVIRMFSKALSCKEQDIGYAGLKDAQAVTRQTLSIPLQKTIDLDHVTLPGVRILSSKRHLNKLRPGHLAGNFFRIRIRKPHPEGFERARQVLTVLENLGVPNRFGSQRYGVLDNSHKIGHAILQKNFKAAADQIMGHPDQIQNRRWQKAAEAYLKGDLATALKELPNHCRPERKLISALSKNGNDQKAVLSLPRKLLRLYLSAYQSSLFNILVNQRLLNLGQLCDGDIAIKHSNGACFLVTDADSEQGRAQIFEISPTAPLYGYKVKLAKGPTGQAEQELLTQEGLKPGDFRLSQGLSMEGERRPLRVPLRNPTCSLCENDLILTFSLPKGSYATMVMAEVIKGPVG
jgi:tRNA pseudouridine13 synthase